MALRKKLPDNISREILFKNESACCICQKSNVQIHHIDGNNSNNKLENLAILCIEHHALASVKSLMTQSLKPSLVRQYKLTWESHVLEKRRIIRQRTSVKRNNSEFIKFEITRLVYSFSAFPDKKTTNSIIEQLYNWSLLGGYTREVIDQISNTQWFLNYMQISMMIDRLYNFFWQYINPKEISMTKKETQDVVLGIELLGDMTVRILVLEENPKVFDKIFKSMSHFCDIAEAYNKTSITRAIKNQISEIKKELLSKTKYPQRKTLLMRIEGVNKRISKIPSIR